jgi:hypothetical protein
MKYVRDIATGLSYCDRRCWIDRHRAFSACTQGGARAS